MEHSEERKGWVWENYCKIQQNEMCGRANTHCAPWIGLWRSSSSMVKGYICVFWCWTSWTLCKSLYSSHQVHYPTVHYKSIVHNEYLLLHKFLFVVLCNNFFKLIQCFLWHVPESWRVELLVKPRCIFETIKRLLLLMLPQVIIFTNSLFCLTLDFFTFYTMQLSTLFLTIHN